jgi:hypothetical protein
MQTFYTFSQMTSAILRTHSWQSTHFIRPCTILHATGFGLPPNFEDCWRNTKLLFLIWYISVIYMCSEIWGLPVELFVCFILVQKMNCFVGVGYGCLTSLNLQNISVLLVSVLQVADKLYYIKSYWIQLTTGGKRFTVCTEIVIILGTVWFSSTSTTTNKNKGRNKWISNASKFGTFQSFICVPKFEVCQ